MYENFSKFIEGISNFMYSYLLIILLLAVGLYFTFRTKFVQMRLLKESIRLVTEKKGDKNAVSPFEALMVSTASRVGTGNIVGVANAIAIGGYGAVFWMWVIAIVGGASAFIESTLAQIYKKRDKDGGSYGGPAYYIEAALKRRWPGVVFAVALIATYAIGFNMLCSYNLITSLSEYSFYGVGTSYIVMALITMVINFDMLPMVFENIFRSAFDFRAIFGGFAGSALMQGIKRGLYSNEAGVGSAPNAAATADVSHPVKQGLVQMLSVFIDKILVCTATAMMCLSSGITPSEELTGAPFVQTALSATFGDIGYYFVTIALLLFAFTTLLGNLFYCEGCLNYIANRPVSKTTLNIFRILASLVVFVGALLDFGLVWNLADVLMGFMALIHLPVIVILGKVAIAALDDYCKQRKEGMDPVFKASTVGLKGKTDFWN